MSNIQILKDYKPIIESDHTYYCYYGGRGGGKTENIALMLVLMAVKNKDYRILCIRELDISIKESVHQAIKDAIDRLGLLDMFKITNSEISCYASGSKFIFSGMNEIFARKVKSIKRINLTWVEEATDISEATWLTLVPSVLRTPNSKMVVSFNPLSSDDIVYKIFVKNTPPPDSHIRKVCYYNNPFFKDSPLEKQRLHQLQTLPIHIYNHIWEGDILNVVSNALWDTRSIDNMFAEVDSYYNFSQIVIACDPATTSKDFSNEYGVVALGLYENGTIWVLKDYSSSMTPDKFANVVNDAVKEWNEYCDVVNVVVETNQGGDFIKHTILSTNPFLNVIEVRAGADKVQRATPVVNLSRIGNIFIDKSQDFTNLVRQMKLITFNGFLGSKGESPDRLDAFVWGVYYLADISNSDTHETAYQIHKFIHDKSFSFIDDWGNAIGYIDNGYVFVLLYDLVSNSSTEKRILITDSFICKTTDFKEVMKDFNLKHLFMPQNELTYAIGEMPCVTTLYSVPNLKLDEMMEQHEALIEKGAVMLKDSMPIRKFELDKGELIKMQLITYKRGQKKQAGLVMCLHHLLNQNIV